MATRVETHQQSALLQPESRELATMFLAIRRHLRLSAGIVLVCLGLAALSLLLPKSYTADATLTYDPQTSLVKGGGSAALTDAQRDAGLDAQLAQVTSLPVAEDVARSVDLAANPRLQQEADSWAASSDRKLGGDEALGTALLDHVKARRVGQTAVFTISFTAHDADQAARIANGFAASYLAAALQQKAAPAEGSTQGLTKRVADLREQASNADGAVAAFRLANHLLNAPDSTALEQEVATLRGQLADARGQAAQAGARGAGADDATVVGGGFGGSVDTTPVSALTQQRAATAADLSGLLSRYGEKYPDVVAGRQRLAELDAQLAQAMHGNRASAVVEARAAAARAQALSGSLADSEARLNAVLSHSAQLADLQNSALAVRLAYQDALKLNADQTAQRALIQPDAQQIGLATPPLRAKFPRLGVNLAVGLALGLVIAVATAFVREHWLHTLGSVEDIGQWLEADYFAPLPLLAPSSRGWMRRDRGCDPIEVVLQQPRSAFAESLRSLAASAMAVGRVGAPNGGRLIGVTSALPGEGGTTVSLAMGRMLAATGMKVALIADTADRRSYRRPQKQALVVDAGVLTEPQRDTSGLALFTNVSGDNGPVHDAEFAKWITALRREYAMIIVEIAAVLTQPPDPRLLKSLDALVLLARWRSTPVRTIREAMRRIATAGGQVSGVALSMVE